MNVGVISFPGSNGDHDALASFEHEVGATVRSVDYREQRLTGLDAVVLPGGFAYGDALRCGAIARFAPIMSALASAVSDGMPILGICNGFQVLCEAHLLPGALLRNKTLRFHCHWAHVVIDQPQTPWTRALKKGSVLRLPVAHGEGAYFADDETLARLESNGQIVARYSEPDGSVTEQANANGSVRNIAAICNERRNVVGLMPHPERASNPLVGGSDGLAILTSLTSHQTLVR